MMVRVVRGVVRRYPSDVAGGADRFDRWRAGNQGTIGSPFANMNTMSVTFRVPAMTRDQFFDWAEAQGGRYEFDGFQPVAMTGGNLNHNRIVRGYQPNLRPHR